MATNTKTPAYIKGLLKPAAGKSQDRKAWSISVERTWLPFFTASNVEGATEISREALGASLRLAKNEDGTAKFSKSGRPVLRLAPELSGAIKMVRENFEAGLVNYAAKVAKDRADDYRAEVEACQRAGAPINAAADEAVQAALDAQMEAAQAEAERIMTQGDGETDGDQTPADGDTSDPNAEAKELQPVA